MEIPQVVSGFLRDVESLRTPQLDINPLSPEESARQSAFLEKHSLFGKMLGPIVLDDANDSNPFCYISRGLGEGMVLQHDHDGSVAIRFPDLASFGEALRDAVVRGDHIDELRFPPRAPHPDQAALRAELRARLTGDDPEAEPFARVFLPLLDPADVETLELAVGSHDFFIRECVARVMARDPLPGHLPFATRLAEDVHSQVQRPARRVLVALKAPLPPPPSDKIYEDDGQRPGKAFAVSMIDSPDGQLVLLFDDIRREGAEPPFSWSTRRFITTLHVDPRSLEMGQLDTQASSMWAANCSRCCAASAKNRDGRACASNRARALEFAAPATDRGRGCCREAKGDPVSGQKRARAARN